MIVFIRLIWKRCDTELIKPYTHTQSKESVIQAAVFSARHDVKDKRCVFKAKKKKRLTQVIDQRRKQLKGIIGYTSSLRLTNDGSKWKREYSSLFPPISVTFRCGCLSIHNAHNNNNVKVYFLFNY